MNEEWRPVVGYEGVYSVSDRGRVRRDTPTQRGPAGRLLKNIPMKIGYVEVSLCWKGKVRRCYVHLLVSRAFLGETPMRMEVNHKDGRKGNPCLDNLEFVTSGGNKDHAVALGLMPRGELCVRSVLTEEQAQYILDHFRLHVDSPKEWAERFNCSPANIAAIAKRRSWKHLKPLYGRKVA